jgi:hypothetical protein
MLFTAFLRVERNVATKNGCSFSTLTKGPARKTPVTNHQSLVTALG